MPTLSITKTYADGNILTEADLDNVRTSIQTFINTTGLDTNNIQANGIAVSDIGISDGEYLDFGTGDDGKIGVSSDDLLIRNVTSNKDIVFKVSPSGSETQIMKVDGTNGTLTMNSKKITGIAAATATTDVPQYQQLTQAVPAGVIQAYSATSAPTGWLLCDGSAVSRTTYATLYAIIGDAAGNGDGSTTFNVPDLRGRFLRGRDAATARDPDAASRTAMNTGGNTGDNLFSLQADGYPAHTHTVNINNDTGGNGAYVRDGGLSANGSVTSSSAGSGTETRPKNANVTFIIKT